MFIVVGIIAVLVIPSLIKYKNDKEIVVGLKKAYNVLSNSYVLARGSVGNIGDWGLSKDFEGSKRIMNAFSPYLKLERRCDGSKGCFKNTTYTYIDGSNYISLDNLTDKSKGMFLDGMSFVVSSFAGCNEVFGEGKLAKVCGIIDIDVNGFRGVNQYGKDTFSFYLTEGGVVPVGVSEDLVNSYKKDCLLGSGRGCTAFVLESDNLDYIEVTYGGKTDQECSLECSNTGACNEDCQKCIVDGWGGALICDNKDYGGLDTDECKIACGGTGKFCNNNSGCKKCIDSGWNGELSCIIDYVEPTYGGFTDAQCKNACSGSGTYCSNNSWCKNCVNGGWKGSLSCKIDYVPPPPPNIIGGGVVVDSPRGNMNWSNANNYCRSQGKRLPSNSELQQIANKCYSNGQFNANNPFGIPVNSVVWSSDYRSGYSHYSLTFYPQYPYFYYFGGGDSFSLSVICVK